MRVRRYIREDVSMKIQARYSNMQKRDMKEGYPRDIGTKQK